MVGQRPEAVLGPLYLLGVSATSSVLVHPASTEAIFRVQPRRGGTPLATGANRWCPILSPCVPSPRQGATLRQRRNAPRPKSAAPVGGLRLAGDPYSTG